MICFFTEVHFKNRHIFTLLVPGLYAHMAVFALNELNVMDSKAIPFHGTVNKHLITGIQYFCFAVFYTFHKDGKVIPL